jgi:hypothetical protein
VTGTVDLLSGLPNIATPVTITGPGAESLDVQRSPSAATPFRLFGVTAAAMQTVTIQGMTISGVRATGFTGGGLFKAGAGTLVLDSVWFTDNQVSGSGGGLHCDGGSMSIRNSTFSANQADFGAAISVNSNLGAMTTCVATLVNSTVSGNSATSFGAGIYVGGTGQITVNSSTIHGNTADSDNASGGSGGGTYNASAQATAITVANTLYAGNKVGTTSPVDNQCGGTHTSSGYNLRQTADVGCNGFTGTGDIAPANPMIGTLTDNGGPTPTIALLTGSPAINAGNDQLAVGGAFPACPATDQRGVSRAGGANRCDIGAFEKRSPTTTAVTCAPTTLTLGVGGSTCTATVGDTLTAPTGDVTFTTGSSGTFSGGGTCTLLADTGTSSCSLTYTPSAVGSGSHLITASYVGTADFAPSEGATQISVLSPPVITPTTPPAFNLKAAIKKCKRKFPKGPKRKKCIKRAKKRAGL